MGSRRGWHSRWDAPSGLPSSEKAGWGKSRHGRAWASLHRGGSATGRFLGVHPWACGPQLSVKSRVWLRRSGWDPRCCISTQPQGGPGSLEGTAPPLLLLPYIPTTRGTRGRRNVGAGARAHREKPSSLTWHLRTSLGKHPGGRVGGQAPCPRVTAMKKHFLSHSCGLASVQGDLL